MELLNHSLVSIISLFAGGGGPLISKPCISAAAALNSSGAEAIIFAKLASGSSPSKVRITKSPLGPSCKKMIFHEPLLHFEILQIQFALVQ